MSSLNLNARPRIQLPASLFPERADIYVCDKCGRDITRHLRPGQAHAWRAIGRERYVCQCGQKYLTRATEWDHFSARERKRRIQFTFGFAAVFSAIISVFGVAAYLALRYFFYLPRAGVVVGALIAVFPLFSLLVPFSLGVASSMWRTRVGARTARAQR